MFALAAPLTSTPRANTLGRSKIEYPDVRLQFASSPEIFRLVGLSGVPAARTVLQALIILVVVPAIGSALGSMLG